MSSVLMVLRVAVTCLVNFVISSSPECQVAVPAAVVLLPGASQHQAHSAFVSASAVVLPGASLRLVRPVRLAVVVNRCQACRRQVRPVERSPRLPVVALVDRCAQVG